MEQEDDAEEGEALGLSLPHQLELLTEAHALGELPELTELTPIEAEVVVGHWPRALEEDLRILSARQMQARP